MLTLTETLDAIRRIDTDPDIIAGACKQYLRPTNTATTDGLSPKTKLVAKILEICNGQGTVSDTVEILIISVVSASLASAKPGREPQILEGLLELLVKNFMSGFEFEWKKLAKTDPISAMENLSAMVKTATK